MDPTRPPVIQQQCSSLVHALLLWYRQHSPDTARLIHREPYPAPCAPHESAAALYRHNTATNRGAHRGSKGVGWRIARTSGVGLSQGGRCCGTRPLGVVVEGALIRNDYSWTPVARNSKLCTNSTTRWWQHSSSNSSSGCGDAGAAAGEAAVAALCEATGRA